MGLSPLCIQAICIPITPSLADSVLLENNVHYLVMVSYGREIGLGGLT